MLHHAQSSSQPVSGAPDRDGDLAVDRAVRWAVQDQWEWVIMEGMADAAAVIVEGTEIDGKMSNNNKAKSQ